MKKLYTLLFLAAAAVSFLVSFLLMIFGNGTQVLCGLASVLLFSICSLVSMALDVSDLDDKIEKLKDSFDDFVALFPKPQSVQDHIQDVFERIPHTTKVDIKKQQLKNDFLLHKTAEPQCARYVEEDSLPKDNAEVKSEYRDEIKKIEESMIRNFVLRRKDIEERLDAKYPSGAETIDAKVPDVKEDGKTDIAADNKEEAVFDVKESPASDVRCDDDAMLNEKAPVENVMDADADESNETFDK